MYIELIDILDYINMYVCVCVSSNAFDVMSVPVRCI